MSALTDAQIEFLKKFHQGFMTDKEINWYHGNRGWESVLGSPVSEVIDLFKRECLISRLDPDSDLFRIASIALQVPQIKELLRGMNAKVSGTKDVLLKRCIELSRQSVRSIIPEESYWVATPRGGEVVDIYLQIKREALINCEDDVLISLANRDYSAAAKRRANYNSTLVFPPGMGCSWSDWDTKRDVEILDYIYSKKPMALALYHPNEINDARLLAALMHLFGGKVSSRLYGLASASPNDGTAGIKSQERKQNERIARLLLFYAIGQVNLSQWKSDGHGFVRVSPCDSSCDSCKELAKRSYPLSNAPQLPNSLCSSPSGCRCSYIPAAR